MSKNFVTFTLKSLTSSGPGKAWIAEAFKPFIPGDGTCAKYLKPGWDAPDTFKLEEGKVYFCHKPHQGEYEIEYSRFYVYVDQEEEVRRISHSEANRRLIEANAEKEEATPSTVYQMKAPASAFVGGYNASLNGQSLTLTSRKTGRRLTIELTGDTLEDVLIWQAGEQRKAVVNGL